MSAWSYINFTESVVQCTSSKQTKEYICRWGNMILHFGKQSFSCSMAQVCTTSSIRSCPKVKQKSISSHVLAHQPAVPLPHLYPCCKTRLNCTNVSRPECSTPFSFVPMLQTQGRSVPLIPHLYPCFETRAMSYTPHQGSLYHHTSFVPLLLYLNHLNPCF